MTDLPLVHPDRPKPAIHPIKALQHFRKLIANKEATEHVFHISNALRGRRYHREAKAFLQSEQGRELLERGENLPDLLDDHAKLWAMPAGSLGRAYVEFMEREGLTANGLVQESDKFEDEVTVYDDQIKWFLDRMRDTHDMNHILTGYGRDPLGEQCVLAFSYSQNHSLGFYFIAYAGGFELKRRAPANTPIFKAVREAELNGRNAQVIGFQDIMALLPLPLEDVRKMLNIPEPKAYMEVHAVFERAGVDPHNGLLAAA